MQANKKLILIVVATLCSASYALEESLVLMIALTAARSFIAPLPSIEVTSTESVRLREGSALPLSDTQCMYTVPPKEQICFGNNLPTRIRLLPAAPVNIGFLPSATSQIENRPLPVPVTDPVFPDIGTLPELKTAFAIATEIQQSAERQREIIEAARQRHQIFSSHRYYKSYYKSYYKGYDKRLDEPGEKGIEADDQDFEWWWLRETDPDTNDSDMATVHDDDSILLEPGSRYCFFSNINDESQARNQTVTDGESESKGDSSSGENSESESEDGDDSDSNVEITHTSTDPLPVSKEVNDYYSAFMLKKIKVEPVYDNDAPILEEIAVEEVEEVVVEAEADSTVCQPFNPPFNPPPAKKKKQTSSGSKYYLCPHPNCGKSYTTYKSLSGHKIQCHTGKQTCNVPVVGEDGLQRPCGKLYKNVKALLDHKRQYHTGKRTCNVPVAGEDGQKRPCGKVCDNANALSSHKKKSHTGKQTCNVPVVGKDGQERPCGKVCDNARALTDHKRKNHTSKRTCNVPVVGENGQERPCGKVCDNARVLMDHKRRYHTGKQTCNVPVVGKDGQERPCGKVCDNARALTDHKRISHTGNQTCDVPVVGEDGQEHPCGKVCSSTKTLANHKRRHRKRKHDDVNPD